MNTAEQTPLYQARLENVKLVTELRELREEMESRRERSTENRALQKRADSQRSRAESYRLRVMELENAIADWLVGDLCEDGLASFIGKVKQAA